MLDFWLSRTIYFYFKKIKFNFAFKVLEEQQKLNATASNTIATTSDSNAPTLNAINEPAKKKTKLDIKVDGHAGMITILGQMQVENPNITKDDFNSRFKLYKKERSDYRLNKKLKQNTSKEINDDPQNVLKPKTDSIIPEVKDKCAKEKKKRIKYLNFSLLPTASNQLIFIRITPSAIVEMIVNLFSSKKLENVDKASKIVFDHFFRNDEILIENNYSIKNFEVTSFITDGIVAGLTIKQKEKFVNIPTLIERELVLYMTFLGIDPGAGDMLVMTHINREHTMKEFQTKNNNDLTLLQQVPASILIDISKINTSNNEKTKYNTVTLSTQHYYSVSKINDSSINREYFDRNYKSTNGNFNINNFNQNMPSHKTIILDELEKYIEYRNINREGLNEYWGKNFTRQWKYTVAIERRRFFTSCLNYFKLFDYVAFGDWKHVKNIKYGVRLPPIKTLLDFCSRNHLNNIHITKEFNTSKLCYDCNNVLMNYDSKEKKATKFLNNKLSRFSKNKYCQECTWIINRDKNASRNINHLGMIAYNNEPRPNLFSKTQTNPDATRPTTSIESLASFSSYESSDESESDEMQLDELLANDIPVDNLSVKEMSFDANSLDDPMDF